MSASIGWAASLLGGLSGVFVTAGVFALLRGEGRRAFSAGDGQRIAATGPTRAIFAAGSLFWLLICAVLVLWPNETATPLVVTIIGGFTVATMAVTYYLFAAQIDWNDDGVRLSVPPFATKRILWERLQDAGYSQYSGFWMRDRAGSRIGWSEYMAGADRLFDYALARLGRTRPD